MSFMLRLALLLGIICFLIPTGNTQSNEEAQIDGSQAVTLARAAMSDARGFCDRQPDACTAGNKIATALRYKIEAGAQALYEFMGNIISANLSQKSPSAAPTTNKTTEPQNTSRLSSRVRELGTLGPSDLKPSWSGPVPLPSSGELPNSQQVTN